jgi:hypothetical protein
MKRNQIPDELKQLLPLTPTVFFVLFSLAGGEKHGYAIMQDMAALSGDKFRMGARHAVSHVTAVTGSGADRGGSRLAQRGGTRKPPALLPVNREWPNAARR